MKQQAAVNLWVEQKPASGRARILLEARELGRNFTVDWEEAEKDERSWEEIIESLKSSVSIPRRLILPCGMEPWEDGERSEGMSSLLHTESNRFAPDWNTLAAKLAQRPFGKYCISSDGELPTELQQEDLERLDVLTGNALATTKERMQSGNDREDNGNAALKFLTWQFRRCPQIVSKWLMDCIENEGRNHPFVRHQASWILVYQGLGRIVGNEEVERSAMRILLTSDIQNWVWNRQSACMAFLLSRSDSAPLLLRRADLERLARRAILDFQRNIGEEYTMFHYAPFLVAGMLRWRLKEPTALLVNVDPLASEILSIIEEAEKDLIGRRRPSANLQRRSRKFLPILRDLKAELLGEGTNPDLLLDIYSAGAA